MARYFGTDVVNFTWALGTTIEEEFGPFPDEYGDVTGAVPRCHIRSALPTSGMLIPLGPAAPGVTGFVLDTVARTLKLTITAKDSYLLTAGLNVPVKVAGDIELRFGSGDTAEVWPLGEFTADVQDRWTNLFATDTP